jgi:hypothetical protein
VNLKEAIVALERVKSRLSFAFSFVKESINSDCAFFLTLHLLLVEDGRVFVTDN